MERLLRLPEIIGNTKTNPPIKGILPISRASWWAGIREGRYPAPVKLGPRTTCWRESDIRRLIEQGG